MIITKQRLSSLVRARLLFKRQIEIDDGGNEIFDVEYLRRLIEQRQKVELDSTKLLISSVASTFLLYLVGSGLNPEVPIWGLKLADVPGVLVFLSFAGSYALAMAVYSFFNSQAYVGLIDQVILRETENGILDADMLKASYEKEWLIFKVLRREFSFSSKPHIRMNRFGTVANSVVFVLLVIITIAPFIVLVFAQPYLTITLIGNDWAGIASKILSIISSISVILLVLVTNTSFECEIDDTLTGRG